MVNQSTKKTAQTDKHETLTTRSSRQTLGTQGQVNSKIIKSDKSVQREVQPATTQTSSFMQILERSHTPS